MKKLNRKNLHEQVLYTQVRVKAAKVGGSGTVIYSKPDNKKTFSTYVITCWHVIEDALKLIKEYDPRIGADRKKEYRQIVTVEFFDYLHIPHGHRPISNSVDAEILAYDRTHDMAILRLRTTHKASYVAPLYPKTEIEKIFIGDKCHAVGCALLHDPIITEGIITHMGDEIDYADYWMSSAQIVFGNSGGAMFYDQKDNFFFVGLPSRVDVAGWGSPITHLGYFSPITRVYKFLDEQLFQFIYDTNFTEDQCKKEREKLKKEAEKKISFQVFDTEEEPQKKTEDDE